MYASTSTSSGKENFPKKTSTTWSPNHQPIKDDSSVVAASSILLTTSQGTETPFAQKLMKILNDKEYRGVLRWSADGKSFSILKRDVFKSRVLPSYFGPIQLKSFKKRLSRHGFQSRQLITLGREDTAYFHPNFLRERPELCVLVVPTTNRLQRKRFREESEGQQFDKVVPSSMAAMPNENASEGGQPPPQHIPPAAFTASTTSIEAPETGDVNGAAAPFWHHGRGKHEQQSVCQEPTGKRMRTQDSGAEMSIGARLEDGGVTTRRHTGSAKVSKSGQANLPVAGRNAEKQKIILPTRVREPRRSRPVPGHTDAPPQILSSCTDKSNARVMTSQADVSDDSDEDGTKELPFRCASHRGATASEDRTGRFRVDCEGYSSMEAACKRDEAERGSEDRPVNSPPLSGERHPILPEAICRVVELAAQLSPTHTNNATNLVRMDALAGVNATVLQSIQERWFRSELWAADACARASFLRGLCLQVANTQGAAGSLVEGTSVHPHIFHEWKSMERFREYLQVALGVTLLTVGRESFSNGNGGTHHATPPNQASQSPAQEQRTAVGHNSQGRNSISAAYDPFAVILEAVPSLRLNFSL